MESPGDLTVGSENTRQHLNVDNHCFNCLLERIINLTPWYAHKHGVCSSFVDRPCPHSMVNHSNFVISKSCSTRIVYVSAARTAVGLQCVCADSGRMRHQPVNMSYMIHPYKTWQYTFE